MVEFAERRLPTGRAQGRTRIVHRELPWAELAADDDELRMLLAGYRREQPLARIELNRGLVLAVALSLLIWLVVAFGAVELLAVR